VLHKGKPTRQVSLSRAASVASPCPAIELVIEVLLLLRGVAALKVAKDLGANPPLKFDLARKVTVFNSQLEFVEFKLQGLSLFKRTVPIPPDLMVPAIDQELQEALRGTFRLLRENSEISGKKIEDRKKKIAGIYLTPLTGYGSVVLRRNKEAFLNEVKDLEHEIELFQHAVRARLGQEMDVNRSRLVAALTPAVCQNPPNRWLRILAKLSQLRG